LVDDANRNPHRTLDRRAIIDRLRQILRALALLVQDADVVWWALRWFEVSQADFADAMLA
jgi:predicted nucleic-acid-binding protein